MKNVYVRKLIENSVKIKVKKKFSFYWVNLASYLVMSDEKNPGEGHTILVSYILNALENAKQVRCDGI